LTLRGHPVDLLDRYIQDSSEFLNAQSFFLSFNNFGQDHRFLRRLREGAGFKTISRNQNSVKSGEISISRKVSVPEASAPALPRLLKSTDASD
jgi:hypothetical protein